MNTAAMIVAPHPNFYADLAAAKKSFVTIAAASTCKESCRLHRLSTLVINGLPAIPAAVVKNVAKYPLALKAVAAAGVKRSCYYRKDRKEWDKPTKPGRSYEQQFKAVTTE